jgi:hypothetical protein
LTVLARVPVEGSGRPLPSAANMVFYAPFLEQGQAMLTNTWLRALPEEHGLTVFSFHIRTGAYRDRDKYFVYPESGWFEDIFAVQRQLEEKYKLPHRPLLIAGESAGASLAEQLAVKYPDRIGGIAMVGGSRFDELKDPTPFPWLILNTVNDSGAAKNIGLAHQVAARGGNALYFRTPPTSGHRGDYTFDHSPSDDAYRLMTRFLVDVADWRTRKPDFKASVDWPLYTDFGVHDTIRTRPGEPVWSRTGISIYSLGDVVRNALPDLSTFSPTVTERGWLPSSDFANVWQRIPVMLAQTSLWPDAKLRVFTMQPTSPPRGAILYVHSFKSDSDWKTFQANIYGLVEEGYAVMAPDLQTLSPDTLSALIAHPDFPQPWNSSSLVCVAVDGLWSGCATCPDSNALRLLDVVAPQVGSNRYAAAVFHGEMAGSASGGKVLWVADSDKAAERNHYKGPWTLRLTDEWRALKTEYNQKKAAWQAASNEVAFVEGELARVGNELARLRKQKKETAQPRKTTSFAMTANSTWDEWIKTQEAAQKRYKIEKERLKPAMQKQGYALLNLERQLDRYRQEAMELPFYGSATGMVLIPTANGNSEKQWYYRMGVTADFIGKCLKR